MGRAAKTISPRRVLAAFLKGLYSADASDAKKPVMVVFSLTAFRRRFQNKYISIFSVRTANGPQTDLERIPHGARKDPERTPDEPRSDPVCTSNGPRTNPEQTPNGPRTDPERTPNGPQTDPERTPNKPRTDPERTPVLRNLLRDTVHLMNGSK